MGLKDFLKQQGFIEEAPADKKNEATVIPRAATPAIEPVYFPIAAGGAGAKTAADPSFVSPPQQIAAAGTEAPDPTFVKFFEDELVKANLPGPDYFEFRQLLSKTQQKMAAKGVVAPDVVLQAVMMSFEAQDITPLKLAEAANHYKGVLKQKNDDFLKGAAAEKNNQVQKRQTVLQGHEDAIKRIQQQLQQLELQKLQLDEALTKEKSQLEADKSLGREGITKIEKAEHLISLAHAHMQAAIDADIKRLQTV
ncbi:MAG: hypothetical protein ABIU63_14335 [Chitinophagaceae bacterium]